MEIIPADESVDFRIVQRLRADDYEVVAIMEMCPGITDEEVLAAANELKAILITEDTDFGELTYRLQIPNHGIILLRMNGASLENRIQQLYSLFEEYKDRLSTSFSVVTIRKIRVISQTEE